MMCVSFPIFNRRKARLNYLSNFRFHFSTLLISICKHPYKNDAKVQRQNILAGYVTWSSASLQTKRG